MKWGVLTKVIGKGTIYNKWESWNSIAKLCKPFQKEQVTADQITGSQLTLTKNSVTLHLALSVHLPRGCPWWRSLQDLVMRRWVQLEGGVGQGQGVREGGPCLVQTPWGLHSCCLAALALLGVSKVGGATEILSWTQVKQSDQFVPCWDFWCCARA